jgi:meiotically up-regulated gene 157 (Mug157) protein
MLTALGIGNPLASGTGLIRSAFRPSDDATILGFLIPANAMMAVELKRTGDMLKAAGQTKLAADLHARSTVIEKGMFVFSTNGSVILTMQIGIWAHAVVEHAVWGKVFAYEIDGYGSHIFMDDANIPSLLALPLLGFVDARDPVYQNTRKMILSQKGNPYFLTGENFQGIGGPHIGLLHAWPMSVLVQAATSIDETEIERCLGMVKNVSSMGLINESVNVNWRMDYTRSWFSWANSLAAQVILSIAKEHPALLFGKDAKPYVIE